MLVAAVGTWDLGRVFSKQGWEVAPKNETRAHVAAAPAAGRTWTLVTTGRPPTTSGSPYPADVPTSTGPL
ncbi:hypothetical protein GCM10009593_23770 [Microlunatus antarcticus]